MLHEGQPIYHIERCYIGKNGPVKFNDQLHIIYVNSEIVDDTPLGKLMHDFRCTDPDEMHFKILADRVRYFKQDEEGVRVMCKAMEDMRNEAAEKAAKQERRRMALKMLAKGKMSHEEIAEYCELSLDEVKELAREKSA